MWNDEQTARGSRLVARDLRDSGFGNGGTENPPEAGRQGNGKPGDTCFRNQRREQELRVRRAIRAGTGNGEPGTGGDRTAKMAGRRPTAGNRDSETGIRTSSLVARRSWVVACASRSWRAAAFARSRRKVCQSAAGTIESSHAARARGKRCPHASFFRLEPRRGE